MAIRIDDAVVQRLIAERLAAAVSITALSHLGEEQKLEGQNPAAKVTRMTITRRRRNFNSTEPDFADLTLQIVILAQVLTPETGSTFAIGTAIAEVTHALDEYTVVNGDHQIDLERPTVDMGEMPTDDGSVVLATINQTGLIRRTSGETRVLYSLDAGD